MEKKNEMMQGIMRSAGPGTKAGAVVFSLPVTDTAGMTLRPQSEELEEEDIPKTEGMETSAPQGAGQPEGEIPVPAAEVPEA